MQITSRAPHVLERAVCERYLRHTYVGRIGFIDEGRPQVLPVNYVFSDGSVVFKTGPGAKLDTGLRRDEVAFEIDGTVDEDHAGWSVMVAGRARVIEETYEIAWARQLALRPWAYGGERPFWVRIDPTAISGRRFG